MVYFGMPYLFARRRGSVPGAAVPQRQARFNKAFPATSQDDTAPRMQCAICIEDLRTGNLKRRLKCRHEFHKVCCVDGHACCSFSSIVAVSDAFRYCTFFVHFYFFVAVLYR
jgi:hypothetical protein